MISIELKYHEIEDRLINLNMEHVIDDFNILQLKAATVYALLLSYLIHCGSFPVQYVDPPAPVRTGQNYKSEQQFH